MKTLLKIVIALVVIIAIVGIAIVVVINLTPRQLKINDVDIAGTSLDDLGLSDMKIIDIIKGIKNLSKVDEADVVKNGYNEEEEKEAVNENTKGSSLEGKDDYSSIVKEKVTYDNQYLKEYKDKDIAYMLDNAIKSSTDTDDESLKTLKDANISIKEITIDKDNMTLRAVGSIQLSSFVGDIEESLGALKSFISIPDTIYLVCELNITGVDAEGKMTFSSKNICINGNNEDPISIAVSKIIVSLTGGEEGDVSSINNELGKALANVIGNLGQIGTADVDSNGVVTGNIQLGVNGIQNNNITVITYKAAA